MVSLRSIPHPLSFSWEYPNQAGIGCNTRSPLDSSNFLLFLQQLKGTTVGKQISISLAVGLNPFTGTNGNPMTDVSGFASVVDYIG
jgi:chitinase